MEIIKGIEIHDLGIYIIKHKIFVIADMHLGYEESLNVKGILIPRIQYKDTYDKLKKILDNLDVETVIITGDFKHEFGVISETEWRNTLQIIDLFFEYAKRVIVIKGNHDVNLGPIARKRNVEIIPYVKFDEILICHGDEILDCDDFYKSRIIIIGHEHPAVGIKFKNKYESYKCFLKGKWENKILIVLPAFNLLTIGTDILRSKLLSPFLQKNLSDFEVFAIQDSKIYNFGKLKNIPNE